MSAQQQLVGAAGVGLVIANAWTGPQHEKLAAIFGSDSDGTATDTAHIAAKQLGGELLAVGALVLLAGSSPAAGNAAAAVLACLWVLWLVTRNAGKPAASSTHAPPHPATQARNVR